jgi:type IV secretory pathway VirJ component
LLDRIVLRRGVSKMTKHEKKGEAKSVSKLKADTPTLAALRKPVLDADAALNKAETEAKALVDKAVDLVTQAMNAYREAMAAYREACRKAGVECEFSVGDSENESQKLTFIVEKADNGVRVLVRGKPKTEDIVPLAILKATIRKAAQAHTGKRVGPRERVGNKGGSAGE